METAAAKTKQRTTARERLEVERRWVIRDIGWDDYEELGELLPPTFRLAFDGSSLEIMVTGQLHDDYADALDTFFKAVAGALGVQFRPYRGGNKGTGGVFSTVGATVAILSPNDEPKIDSRPLIFTTDYPTPEPSRRCTGSNAVVCTTRSTYANQRGDLPVGRHRRETSGNANEITAPAARRANRLRFGCTAAGRAAGWAALARTR